MAKGVPDEIRESAEDVQENEQEPPTSVSLHSEKHQNSDFLRRSTRISRATDMSDYYHIYNGEVFEKELQDPATTLKIKKMLAVDYSNE